MTEARIPLFPLNTVVFPGMLLPLQVFEPRYLELLHDCLEGERRFGVCLIQAGAEVGGPAVPHRIGTTCEILRVEPAEGGRFHLLTVGRERFRIRKVLRERSYLEADVEFLPPDREGELEDLPERVRSLAERLLRRLLAAQGAAAAKIELPTDAGALSFLAAYLLSTENAESQELLEMVVLSDRLRREEGLLSERLQRLAEGRDQRAAARPFQPRQDAYLLN